MEGYAQILGNMISAAINTKFKDVPPTEEEFVAEADKLRSVTASAYPVSDEEYEALVRSLHSFIVVRMDTGIYISAKEDEYKSWLPARRAETSFFFWDRYKRYLEEIKHWNPRMTATLDKVSDEIVDLLGDPHSSNAFQRRGLVLGDVQSGKTANYTAVCNKAADTGYRIIIVMAGIMENLRKQTQERLDAEFSGRLSQYLLDPKLAQGLKTKLVGVGRYGTERRIASFTSVMKDFDVGVLRSNDLALGNVHDPVLMVVKKNKRILNNLITWLILNNRDPGTGKIMLPMLLIDDEADNASINTRNADEDPAAINACIRSLLNCFNKASYLGITATPFANIFINPDTDTDMLGDDLFPRDFLYSLSSPSNYIGPDRVFGEEADLDSYLQPLYANEMDSFFPFDHKKGHPVEELPPSLYEAMSYFLLANAIRDYRGDPQEHRSMMIHVSRFTDVQNSIAELANQWIVQIKSDLRNYAGLSWGQAEKVRNLAFLHAVWEKHGLESVSGVDWKTILGDYLYKAVAPIDIRAVNQKTGAASLDYYNHRDDGLRVIAVGGNSLSRGLTLEGLCVTYFYRKSIMYDTLLQMGRWFGYRPGYDDLVKIWISAEAIDWYGYITRATAELKIEVLKMKRANQTPKDFGLKVRQDPNSLIVTARNKMRSAKVVTRPVTVSGKLLESPRLKADPRILASNEKVFKAFVQRLDETGQRDPQFEKYFWHGVLKMNVSQLLRSFETHPWHLSFQGRALADYIDDNMDDTPWDVYIPDTGSGDEYPDLWCGDERLALHPERRSISANDEQISISGTKVRVGSGGATSVGLTPKQREQAVKAFREENGAKNIPDSAYLVEGRNPLLMLHVIRVDLQKSKDIQGNVRIPKYLFALGVGFPSTGATTKVALYVVNLVELQNWMPIEDEEDDENA